MASFKELGVNQDFIKGMNEIGIIDPTPIQEQVIPLLINGNIDLVGQAQTGTGKTAAYGIPLLQKINPKSKMVQGLILCPTRELGQQVAKQLFKFTKYSDKIFTEAVYGGEPIDRQIARLQRPTHIIVATPGRLIDLLKRKAVDLSAVKTIVLDEGDEMLSMGFKAELEEILSFVTEAKSKWLFSATLPHGINNIVNTYFDAEAARIQIDGRNVVNSKIEHRYLICEEAEKTAILIQFLKATKDERGIIFCRTKKAVEKLSKQLIAKNISADGIQGDMKQLEREKVLRAFKNGKLKLLVATDLAARGLDIPELAYVVHYQMPDHDEYYTHRSGRTARAGKEGYSLALVTSQELKSLRVFEKRLGIPLEQVRG